MKRYLLSVIFFIVFIDCRSQFFFIDENNNNIKVNKNLSDWTELNSNEVFNYFEENKIKYLNRTEIRDTIIYLGEIELDIMELKYTIELIFHKKMIVGLSKYIYFIKPCRECIIKESGLKMIPNLINNSIKYDNDLKSMFKEQSMALIREQNDHSQKSIDEKNRFTIENYFYKDRKLFIREYKFLNHKSQYDFYESEYQYKTKESYFINNINIEEFNTEKIKEMVDIFLSDCDLNGIKIPKSRIEIEMVELDQSILGLSMAKDNNALIKVKINRTNWTSTSSAKKWYVLYHELGHDVLNFNHFEGGPMMNPISERGYSWSEFWQDRQLMFDSYLQNKPKK
jgi:hypothetical protein